MLRNESAIRVQGFVKSCKNIPVLTGVDFEVKAGGIFALLGSTVQVKRRLSKSSRYKLCKTFMFKKE